ncbi:unnamed protein product [Rhodiola kirilowii]
MDDQKNKRVKLQKESSSSFPIFKTQFQMEKHAAEVFSLRIFHEFQDEIVGAAFRCSNENTTETGNKSEYTIKDKDYNRTKFKVLQCISSGFVTCSCNKYQSTGILFRHAFHVLSALDLCTIPKHYILKRWRKDASAIQHTDFSHSDEPSINSTPECSSVISAIWREMRLVVSNANQDIGKLQSVLASIKKIMEDFPNAEVQHSQSSKEDYFQKLLGFADPADLHVKTPRIARNKGCGRHKSTREIAVQKAKKPKRLCRYCNEYGYHDKRNCPKREKEKKSKGAPKDGQEDDVADDYSDNEDYVVDYQLHHYLII